MTDAAVQTARGRRCGGTGCPAQRPSAPLRPRLPACQESMAGSPPRPARGRERKRGARQSLRVRAQCDAADQDVGRATALMHRILRTFRRRLSLHGPSRRDTLASHAQRCTDVELRTVPRRLRWPACRGHFQSQRPTPIAAMRLSPRPWATPLLGNPPHLVQHSVKVNGIFPGMDGEFHVSAAMAMIRLSQLGMRTFRFKVDWDDASQEKPSCD